MKFYFSLLFKRLNRQLKDLGIEPLIASIIFPCLFYWVSLSFFDKFIYANYLYSFITILIVFVISFPEHDDFIKQQFSPNTYRSIKIINHLLLVLPFVCFLLFKLCYFEVLIVVVLTVLLSYVKKPNKINFVIPTPFYRWPYEFTVGFRKTYLVFLFSYGISILSIYVDNFNLGVFAILSIFFLCSFYYSKLEPQFYIWVHAESPQGFLKNKIRIAGTYSFFLSLPILVILFIFYADQIHIAFIFELLGFLYMVMYIIMKYAFNSSGVSMLQGVIGVLCLLFPPALLLIIPYYYSRAINNLNKLLK